MEEEAKTNPNLEPLLENIQEQTDGVFLEHKPVFNAAELPDDKFSKGRVVKYFPQSKYGFIKDHRGKDLYFNIDEIRFAGQMGREHLKEGIVVGYDVGWTSHGLHVCTIKIY